WQRSGQAADPTALPPARRPAAATASTRRPHRSATRLATRAPHAEQPREPATAAQPPADRILPEPVALRSLVFTFHHRSIFSRPFETTTQLRCITLLRRVVAELAFHSQAEPDGCSGRAIAAVQFNE